MESAPTTEAVYEGVYTLYNNKNTVEQERASKWLEQLQNSVSLYRKTAQKFIHDKKKETENCSTMNLQKKNKIHNHTFALQLLL